ncbi:MAG: hypothetical protein EPN17_01745 [Methylobacter sp.]|nr:MAG: hypothetical protein EPN17_01745 [Methylobacter sp.]
MINTDKEKALKLPTEVIMRKRKKMLNLTILLLLISFITACSTPRQWQADRLLDELCAKDGGIKVYETVTLPKEQFDQSGHFTGISFDNRKVTYEYYSTSEDKHIQNAYSESGGLAAYRNHFFVYRRKDNKLLGESIFYSRFGGGVLLKGYADSSYTCPKDVAPDDLLKKIFLKSN